MSYLSYRGFFMPSNVIRHLKHQTLAYVILQRDFLLCISYWISCSEMFTRLGCIYRRLYGFTRWFKFSRNPSENQALFFALFMVFVHRLRFRKVFRFYTNYDFVRLFLGFSQTITKHECSNVIMVNPYQ